MTGDSVGAPVREGPVGGPAVGGLPVGGVLRAPAYLIISAVVGVGGVEVALEGIDEPVRIFLPVVRHGRDVVSRVVAQTKEISADVPRHSTRSSTPDGRSGVRVDVKVLVASASNGTVLLDLEEEAPLVLPVAFLGDIADGVLPRFSVKGVWRVDTGRRVRQTSRE